MGTLVKRLVCSAAGLDPAAVYHAAVMPCYDKKLEASRADFSLPGAHPHLRHSWRFGRQAAVRNRSATERRPLQLCSTLPDHHTCAALSCHFPEPCTH